MVQKRVLRLGLLCSSLISVFAISAAPGLLLAKPSAPAQATRQAPPASFSVCATCHAVERNAPPRIGPNLVGVAGRLAGSQPGYNYSAAMKASNIRWNRANLLTFVGQPRTMVPGTRMPFAGVKDRAKAGEIVDYLLNLR